MTALLVKLGEKLGFHVFTEVEASEAAWIDVVWCDPRFTKACLPNKKPKLRRAPVLPIVAFEVENKTGLNAKHVKGSVSNLNNSGAQMGVIVIGDESFALLAKQPAHAAKKPQAYLSVPTDGFTLKRSQKAESCSCLRGNLQNGPNGKASPRMRPNQSLKRRGNRGAASRQYLHRENHKTGDNMRFKTTSAVVVAFVAGLVLSPLAQHAMSDARAQASPLAPAMIDLMALKHGDIPTTPNPEMNARPFVVTENATIGVQSGNIAKHIHQQSDEVQYIIEGSGSMWLGGERQAFKPGTLIIIPRGTAHAGAIITNGPVKAIAIKIPPQAKDDIVFVN